MASMPLVVIALFLCLLTCEVAHAGNSPALTEAQAQVRELAPGVFQIGLVRIETKEKRLVFPGQVNMVEGPLEYVLVSAIGKLHESIFKTEALPTHIHTAALLLLKKPPSSNSPAPVRVFADLPGTKQVPADSLVLDVNTGRPMPSGDWSYLGSHFSDGVFVAQRDGSIVSIIADPDSLIQSGRVAADDDDRWRPARTRLPPIGTPVTLILQFVDGAHSNTNQPADPPKSMHP